MIKEQLAHPRLFLLTAIIIVLAMLSLAVQLQQDSSLDSLIPSDGEFNSNEELLRRSFNQGDTLLLIIERDESVALRNAIPSLQDPAVVAYATMLTKVLYESQYVSSVSELEYATGKDVARLFITVNTPETTTGDKEVKAEIEYLVGQVGTPPGVKAQLTGLPLLIDRISTLLIQDNLTTILLTVVFIMIVLYSYFRNWRYVMPIIISPIISLIILAGLMVVFGVAITIPLAAVGVLVLGLGVDYSIHIATHYKYDRLAGTKHRQAILNTFRDLRLPITASFLTTLAGFAALLFGVSPSTQDQGIVLSLAIVIIFAVSFAIFPVLLTVFARNTEPKSNRFFGHIKSGLAKLAIYQTKHPKAILGAFGIITLIMFYGMTQVQFSTSNSNWIPDNDPLSLALRQDASAFGDDDSIILILKSTQGDLRNVQTIKDIQKLESALRKVPNVDVVNSVFTNLPLEQVTAYEKLTNSGQFNEDYTIALIRITSQNLASESGTSRVLHDVRAIVTQQPLYHTEVKFFGDTIRFEELSESLQQDAAKTTVAGILLVFFIASAIYASVSVGLIALIPILIGLVWAIGLMGFFGVPFTSLSTGIVSLVLGIGIDFSIHLVDGIKRYLKKYSLENAISKTLINSGTSILLSSITTFIGFIALTFSQLLGTQRLGWSLALAVLSVFIVAILTVPAIMKITKVKK